MRATEFIVEGVAEGFPQPGPSSGAPKQFGTDAEIQTRQMTVKDIISSVPGVPYYNNVVDDWDAKDYSWGVTKKVIEYATYLKDHPESLAKLPPAIVLNGKFEDGAHRVSAIWLLQQRMDPKNPLWKNAKLNVQFVKQGVAEGVESLDYQGNCTEDEVVDEIFGDVNNFARMVEEHGDEFTVGKLVVKYDPETDIHSFYYKKSGVAEGFSNDMSTEDMIAYLRQHHDTNLHQDYLNHVNTFSKFVLKDIPTNTLKTDLPGLDREKVERYKKMDQSKAPPIVLGGKYILDGYHRANAVKELGIPTIKAYVGIPSK